MPHFLPLVYLPSLVHFLPLVHFLTLVIFLPLVHFLSVVHLLPLVHQPNHPWVCLQHSDMPSPLLKPSELLYLQRQIWSVAVDQTNQVSSKHKSVFTYEIELLLILFGTILSTKSHFLPPFVFGILASENDKDR